MHLVHEALEQEENTEIKNFVEHRLRPTQIRNQVVLLERLQELLDSNILSTEARLRIEAIKAQILDPVQAALATLENDGYITAAQRATWQEEAETAKNQLLDKVRELPLPNPEHALAYMRMDPLPTAPNRPSSDEVVTWNGAKAQQAALASVMKENPNVLLFGTDVNKGSEILPDGKMHQVGSYFHQTDGLIDLFGHEPGRVTNTPIVENIMAAFLMGMGITPTDPESLKNSLMILYDPQYADYGIQTLEALHILASVYQTTDGKFTRRFGLILEEGAVAGGGPMHSHSVAGEVNATKYSITKFSVSDPKTLHDVLRWCLLYETNPFIIMVAKEIYLGKANTFEIGTGLFEAGRAKVDRTGKDVQVITYGPARLTVLEAVKDMQDVGVLDLVSHNPFPWKDLKEFLCNGKGPIVIVGQEAAYKAFTAHVRAMLEETDDLELREILRGRDILRIDGKNVPEISPEKTLMNAVIPTVEGIRETIESLRTNLTPGVK